MAKGTGVRQREKKKKSSSLYHKEVACSSSVKPANEQKIKENLLTENFWKYCCFSLLLLLGVLCVLLSRNLRSSSHNSLYLENIGFPCNFGDEFSIDRRSNLSLEEFIYCYDAKRPVLITDVMRNWRAMSWTKSFLVSNYGEKRVSMRATEGALHEAKGFAVPLNMFAQHAHEGKPRLWTYLEDELFIEMNPELREHLGQPVYLYEDFFQLLPKEIRPWNAMLLWGTAHSRSTLHIDPYNWTGTNAVLSGRKMWKLYPPGQDHFLSVRRNQRCGFPLDCMKYNSPIDAYNPDFKKFPEFRQARAISFTQEAGELLIIPTGWFHQAFNPVETMAISSQVMNSQNYKLVLEEIYKAGEVDPKNLPKHFHSLSAKQQVEAVVKIIPRDVISKGKMVTESLLNQLKWDGKGASINYKMT